MKIFTFFSILLLSTSLTFGQVISQFPYQENFDGNLVGWSASGAWALGTPGNKNYINRTFSAPNAWVTTLNGLYPDNSWSYLTTPRFNFSNKIPILSFRQMFDSESGYDGMRLEYRIGNGAWIIIPSSSTSQNWYNGSTGLLGNCWSGSIDRNNYILSEEVVLAVTGQNNVQFRFFFRSDGSVRRDGFAIDNFRIEVSRSDIEAIGIEGGYIGGNPSPGCQVPPDSLFLVLKNNLHLGIGSFPVEYQIGSNTRTIFANIGGLETKKIYLPPPYNFQNGLNNVRAWSNYIADIDNANDSASYAVTINNQVDLDLLRLISPSNGVVSCSGPRSDLRVEVRNLTFTDLNEVRVSYRFKDSTFTDTISSVVRPACAVGSYLHSFSKDLYFPSSGSYDISIWVDHVLDNNASNDTIRATLNYIENLPLPYLEDFNNSTAVDGTGNDKVGVLPIGWFGLHVGVRDTYTGVTDVGPSSDYGGQGNYINFFQQGSNFGILQSPCINIPNTSNDIFLDFRYFMDIRTSSPSGIIIDDINNSVRVSTQIPFAGQSNPEDPYASVKLNINSLKGLTVRVAFQSFADAGAFSVDYLRIYEVASTDLEVVNINSPSGSECGNQNDGSVTIQVDNVGFTSVSNFELCYQVNGNAEVCEVVSGGTINPTDQPISFTFAQKVDFSNPGNYGIKAYSKLATDGNTLNDTAQSLFKNSSALIPFNSEFDSSEIVHPSFVWEESTGQYRWVFTKGSTPSFNTGPLKDADDDDNGYYAYTESLIGSMTGEAAILSNDQCFDFNNTQTLILEYNYHMYGTSIDKLYLVLAGDSQNVIIDSLIGAQQSSSSDPWGKRKISLSNINMNQAFFSFVAVKGNGEQGDIAIDNFRVRDSTVTVNELLLEEDLTIFPIPTKNILHIQGPFLEQSKGLQYQLFDANGSLELEGISSNERTLSIDVSNFPAGIYFIRITNGFKWRSQKLIIQE